MTNPNWIFKCPICKKHFDISAVFESKTILGHTFNMDSLECAMKFKEELIKASQE